MASKYDLYWQTRISDIVKLIAQAAKYGTSKVLDVSDIKDHGNRINWYGVVEVSKLGIRKGEMAHVRSLGNVIFESKILDTYGNIWFRFTISNDLKLRVERLPELLYVNYRPRYISEDLLFNNNQYDTYTNPGELVEIFREIPWSVWENIVKNEPEWKFMRPLLDQYNFGPFAVLMVSLGLNDFQLKGKADKVYWPRLYALLINSPCPHSPEQLFKILIPFFQKERLPSLKIKRLRHFLYSDLAANIWVSSPHEISGSFLDLWKKLANT